MQFSFLLLSFERNLSSKSLVKEENCKKRIFQFLDYGNILAFESMLYKVLYKLLSSLSVVDVQETLILLQ